MGQIFDELTIHISNEIKQVFSQVNKQKVIALRQVHLSGGRNFFAGPDRSGMQIKGEDMRLMLLGLQVFVIRDIITPAITKNALLLIGSG